jgi:hypothetical protein
MLCGVRRYREFHHSIVGKATTPAGGWSSLRRTAPAQQHAPAASRALTLAKCCDSTAMCCREASLCRPAARLASGPPQPGMACPAARKPTAHQVLGHRAATARITTIDTYYPLRILNPWIAQRDVSRGRSGCTFRASPRTSRLVAGAASKGGRSVGSPCARLFPCRGRSCVACGLCLSCC